MNVPKVIPNDLRFEDVGMVAWIQSRLEDGDKITSEVFGQATPSGRDKVRGILTRLEAAGILEREQIRSGNRIMGIEYKLNLEMWA